MLESYKRLFLCGFLLFLVLGLSQLQPFSFVRANEARKVTVPERKIQKTDKEWRKLLTSKQFYVLRQKGTERAFSGKYWNTKAKGVYHCSACGAPLFESTHKFKSGTGWPSFYQTTSPKAVAVEKDLSLGVLREEILCARCGGHLGHVFDDGPHPTGLRYCVNSASLNLVEEQVTHALDAGVKKKN